ncbi:MAG TPA: enoyl-CoA hydratase/isomerase family protein [Usitatibacter sp.]|nr:enoyl-CoA hydratase/isomerase family protein [Usitatibacter sp.]
MEERLSRGAQALAAPPAEELLAHVHAGVATVTLNRPAAHNALSWAMLLALRERLDAWERDESVRVIVLRGAGDKAFCAGGDVRSFHAAFRERGSVDHEFFTVEYALDFRIHTYPKPIVAVMDGIVMGGGMGLAQGAALRIAGERTRMAMPETAIGLFPDVGGSYFLSRTPGAVGEYLALAGPTIRAADALYCGLADLYLSHASIGRLDEWLKQAAAARDPRAAVKALVMRDERSHLHPPEIAAVRDAIDRHFGAPTVEAIVACLEAPGAHREWAQRTREAILRHSPTALKIALEQVRRGRTLALADCFRMELGLVRGCLEHGDFFEGIRAMLVDKDRNPRWRPPRLEDVGPADVERFFHPRWTPAQHPLSHLQQ